MTASPWLGKTILIFTFFSDSGWVQVVSFFNCSFQVFDRLGCTTVNGWCGSCRGAFRYSGKLQESFIVLNDSNCCLKVAQSCSLLLGSLNAILNGSVVLYLVILRVWSLCGPCKVVMISSTCATCAVKTVKIYLDRNLRLCINDLV